MEENTDRRKYDARLVLIENDVKLILTNHLPHINIALGKLEISLKIYGGLIIAGITALIVLGLTP